MMKSRVAIALLMFNGVFAQLGIYYIRLGASGQGTLNFLTESGAFVSYYYHDNRINFKIKPTFYYSAGAQATIGILPWVAIGAGYRYMVQGQKLYWIADDESADSSYRFKITTTKIPILLRVGHGPDRNPFISFYIGPQFTTINDVQLFNDKGAMNDTLTQVYLAPFQKQGLDLLLGLDIHTWVHYLFTIDVTFRLDYAIRDIYVPQGTMVWKDFTMNPITLGVGIGASLWIPTTGKRSCNPNFR